MRLSFVVGFCLLYVSAASSGAFHDGTDKLEAQNVKSTAGVAGKTFSAGPPPNTKTYSATPPEQKAKKRAKRLPPPDRKTELAAAKMAASIHAEMGIERVEPGVVTGGGGGSGHENPADVARYMKTLQPLRRIVQGGGDTLEIQAAMHMVAEHCEQTAKEEGSFKCFLDYVNDASSARETALYWAAKLRRPAAVVKLLLSAGIDITVKTLTGKRAHDVVRGSADVNTAIRDTEAEMLRTGKLSAPWWHKQYGVGFATTWTPKSIQNGHMEDGTRFFKSKGWTYKDQMGNYLEQYLRSKMGDHIVDLKLKYAKQKHLTQQKMEEL